MGKGNNLGGVRHGGHSERGIWIGQGEVQGNLSIVGTRTVRLMVDHRHARPLPEGPGIFISEVLVIVQNHIEVDISKTTEEMIAQWWNSRDT